MNDSWLCVLLDGHHKATAAALEGRPVKTWVISQPVAMTCYETRQQCLRFYDGERLEEAQFQRRIPLKIQYEKLPPSFGRITLLAMTNVIPASTGRTHWLTAQRIIPILRPAQILLPQAI